MQAFGVVWISLCGFAKGRGGIGANEIEDYLQTDAPVGRHLADQLLVPLAMAGEGSFRALPLSRHTKTNAEVVSMFLPVRVEAEQPDRVAHVRVTPA